MHFKHLLQFAHEHRIPIHPERRYIGVIFTTFAWLLIALTTVLCQEESKTIPLSVNFFIQFIIVTSIYFICILTKGIRFVIGNEKKLLWIRALLGLAVIYAYYAARMWTKAVDNSILFSTDALFIPLIMFLFLKIRFHALVWVGLVIGFIGVIFIYTYDIQFHSLGGMIGIFSGIGVATIVILSSFMVKSDPPLRIAFYQAFVAMLGFGLVALFNWKTPSVSDMIMIASSALLWSLHLLLLLDSLYYTEPHIIGALSYTLVIFVEFLEWIVHRIPTPYTTLIGFLLIGTGGMMVIGISYHMDKKRQQTPFL